MAEHGIKGMIPIDRPFLDYCISALADAGCAKVCLVIGPEHRIIREYYEALATRRVSISFAVQQQPLGTADAVCAAIDFVGHDSFVVVNSDNYYPAEALNLLRRLDANGVVGFERRALIENGNIDEDRLRGYAVLHLNDKGELERIEEKPPSVDTTALISMNSWSFTPTIFAACTAIPPSARGEYEIPSAVQYAIDHMGEHFRVVPFHGGVLDLSMRSDIESVAQRLRGCTVRL
jgi:glucose-1-phosphate thymidylyltransferase